MKIRNKVKNIAQSQKKTNAELNIFFKNVVVNKTCSQLKDL